MLSTQRLVALFFLVVLWSLPPAHGYDFNKSIREKQAQKDAKRWSLSEWLAQKKDNQLMDMWLMYNTPSPYEFFLGADTSTLEQTEKLGTTESSATFRNYRGQLGAFVTMVGLFAEYETSDEEYSHWKGLLLLRLLGSSDQSTNFTLHVGLLQRTLTENQLTRRWQHPIGGGKIQIYLLQPLALTAQYEFISAEESQDTSAVSSSGQRLEGGVHLEYGALRFYGLWFQETMDYRDDTTQWERLRQGVAFGTRIYF